LPESILEKYFLPAVLIPKTAMSRLHNHYNFKTTVFKFNRKEDSILHTVSWNFTSCLSEFSCKSFTFQIERWTTAGSISTAL